MDWWCLLVEIDGFEVSIDDRSMLRSFQLGPVGRDGVLIGQRVTVMPLRSRLENWKSPPAIQIQGAYGLPRLSYEAMFRLSISMAQSCNP